MVNDTISDLLTRIRNANLARHEKVFVLNTKINYAICKILKKEGFIQEVVLDSNPKSTKPSQFNRMIELILKYSGNSKKPCLTNLKRLSSPSLRFYSHYQDIPRLLNGMGVIIVTTSKGVMTDREARSLKIGGEILCSIW